MEPSISLEPSLLLRELEEKANILVYGIRVSEETASRTGAGTTVREGSFHHLGSARLPVSFNTPGGLSVGIRREADSPYELKRKDEGEKGDGGFFVVKGDGTVVYESVTFPPRPAFYNQTTSDGKPMASLATLMDGGCLMVWFTNECAFQEAGTGCLFCGIRYSPGTAFLKTPEQIAEVVRAAFEEGVARRVDFSGGVIAQRREIDYYARAMERIRAVTGRDDVTASACIAVPGDFAYIKLLKEAGFTHITMNMEVWDRHIFQTICPGKAANGGHDKWVNALAYAAEVFGKGHVRCNFVTGLEPKHKTLEGVRELAALGVVSHPNVFDPIPGTPLEGMRCPTPAWNLDLHKQTADILRNAGIRFEDACDCHPMNAAMFYDFWRIAEGRGFPKG